MPDRIKILVWKVYHTAIPGFDNLRKRGCVDGKGCCFCGYAKESEIHLFFQCWWAKSFRKKMEMERIINESGEIMSDWLWTAAINEFSLDMIRRAMARMCIVWRNKNQNIRGDKGWTFDVCVLKVTSYLELFNKRSVLGHPNLGESEVDCVL